MPAPPEAEAVLLAADAPARALALRAAGVRVHPTESMAEAIEALAAGDASVALWEAQRNMSLLADALGMDVEIVGGVWNGADPA